MCSQRILVLCALLVTSLTSAKEDVRPQLPFLCCLPEQYEAFIILSSALVDVEGGVGGGVGDGMGFTNGTNQVVYDGVNERTYTHSSTMNYLSIYPIPVPIDSTYIIDYKQNVQYRVYGDGSCDLLEVGMPLYKECVPGNARVMSRGRLGDSGPEVLTVLFRDRIYLDPYEITLTLTMSADRPGECLPIRGTASQAYVFDSDKNVDIATVDVLDITRGVHDPRVFVPPSNCKRPPKAFLLVTGGEAILMNEQGISQFGYGYTNGSVQTAYDSINQRTYIHQQITSINSRYPGQPQLWNFIDIIHYQKRTRWRIYGDSSCEEYHDVMSPLWVECIPENATLVSRGRVGSRGEGATYRFRHSIYLAAYELTVNVALNDSCPGQCWPVSVTSSQSYMTPSNKNVVMTSADVLDLTEGIADERIFQPPFSCFKNLH